MKFIRRIIKWLVLTVLLAAAVLWVAHANSDFSVAEYTVKSDRLPNAFDGFRVAQISDLHNASWSDLPARIAEGKADAILVTGDLVSRGDDDIPRTLLGELCELAPVYYVPGNHEAGNENYPAMRDALAALGVTVLEDSSVTLERDGEKIRIAGIFDPIFKAGKKASSDELRDVVDKALETVIDGDDAFTLLLSHRPEYMMLYEAHSVDVVFSGHAHGGGVRLPFIGAVWAPGQGLFPTYTRGLYKSEYCDMIVSAGLGHSSEPFHINCPYELVFCTLTQG